YKNQRPSSRQLCRTPANWDGTVLWLGLRGNYGTTLGSANSTGGRAQRCAARRRASWATAWAPASSEPCLSSACTCAAGRRRAVCCSRLSSNPLRRINALRPNNVLFGAECVHELDQFGHFANGHPAGALAQHDEATAHALGNAVLLRQTGRQNVLPI